MNESAGVIFDMDGVLVDSADAHRRAWQQLGDEIGTRFTAEMFQRTFGQRNASIIPRWLGTDVADARVESLGDRKEEIYRSLVRSGACRIYSGVTPLFRELRAAGARLAIASSAPRANVDLLIELMETVALVDVVVAAEDVAHGKPNPEVFLTAARRLELKPTCCAVVEDSVHGIEAAKAAAMIAVAVLTSTPRAALAAAGADLFLAEVGELRADGLLRRLKSP
ncbi:MAG TPA: beta-phosphoglucomutase family hydrolase [Candidatus Acidoferrales bacterium]|nr:beta-phosphoglucomutase family hydrolase [Candidatus Acidoferrales bacterium]